MANRSYSRHELNKIKNMKSKSSKNLSCSIIDSSNSDSDSSLYSDSDWDKKRQPTELKDINKLDHILTNYINNKN